MRKRRREVQVVSGGKCVELFVIWVTPVVGVDGTLRGVGRGEGLGGGVVTETASVRM